jgi:hypothetical protein
MLHQHFILHSTTDELHMAGGILDFFGHIYFGQQISIELRRWHVTGRVIGNVSGKLGICFFVRPTKWYGASGILSLSVCL